MSAGGGMEVSDASIVAIDDAQLARWPLPFPDGDADKEARGRVLIVAGSCEVPGAALLAAEAAMRAGAGKLAIATAEPVAHALAVAVPESLVVGLPCTSAGALDARAALDRLAPHAARIDALLVGPGMDCDDATCALVRGLLEHASDAAIVLDAAAMHVLRPRGDADAAMTRFERPVLLTPHAGEMAALTGLDKSAIVERADAIAARCAVDWNAVVALKGATTHVATPDGRVWRNERGDVGLGASGSGDVLAGLIVGLAARGAPLEQAAVWGVALHAHAGERLARRVGRLGYLARELASDVPALMDALGGTPAGRRGA